MKNFIHKLTTLAMIAAAGFAASSADAATFTLDSRSPLARTLTTPKPVRQFRGHKPWDHPGYALNQKLNIGSRLNAPIGDPTTQFSELNNFNYLEAPDGSTWFYTAEYDYKTVQFEGGYKEDQIVAYTFTIYDESFKKIGTIHDDVDFRENETRVASAVLDPAVTTKFFNYDSKYEVMVYIAMNTGEDLGYKVNFRNRVYSIDGQKEGDNDVCIAEVDGRCVDAVNASTNSWSENFYLTFAEDIDPDPDLDYDSFVDFVNAYKTRVTTYKKADYSGEFSEIFTHEIPLVCIPGDTTDGIYFISKLHNGTVYFIYSQYENPYFIDPTGFAEDESATPQNNFLIDVYALHDGASTLQKVSHTSIEANQANKEGQVNYTFYSIGSLAWHSDIDMSVNGTPTAPAFIVARDFTTAAMLEDVVTNFEIYGTDGKLIKTLAQNTDGVLMLSDITGAEAQAMFITLVDDKYTFEFTNIYSGTKVMTLNQAIDGDPISAVGDRIPTGSGNYRYAFVMSYDDVDNDGNELPRVAWINPDGTLDHIDRINCGPNVARATINFYQKALSPYLYDTDPGMEYAVLVGRYTGNSVSEVKNEFIIVDNDGSQIANFSEADGKGLPYTFTIVHNEKRNILQMIYNNNYKYNIDIYNLPFSMFSGGDGTAQNPYQIASVADLQLIKLNPAAHYVIVDDFDAAGFEFAPISTFTGSLDGQGHTIYNLELRPSNAYTGIFESTEPGSSIKNITFVDPVLNLGNSPFAGLLVGYSVGLTVDNVKVYNLLAKGSANTFGGLIGQATSATTISSSAVIASTYDATVSDAVGGLVGDARTGLTVTASAFSGSITSTHNIGGIVGQSVGQAAGTGNVTIADCHVDAKLSGKNNIGGIIGLSNRSKINRCYVEGSIDATQGNAGGIVGSLDAFFSTDNEVPVIISANVVALKEITTTGKAAHRIVGYTIADDSQSAAGEVELGLADNYAIASLSPLDADIDAVATSTEGASIDEIKREFLDETLGWKFGTTVEEPWHTATTNDPLLYFESSFIILPTTITVEEGETFNINIRFLGDEEISLQEFINAFICEYDNTIIDMTGEADLVDGVITVEFEALKIGSTDVTVNINGLTATAKVNVVEPNSGVAQIVAPALDITFNGATVSAPGAEIEIYNTTGTRVASGIDAVAVDNLARGIYIAVARNAAGTRTALKIKR